MHFADLTPELILDTLCAQGFDASGVLFPLNSYENRVYEVALNEAEPVVAKFYRPERWSAETVLDEHHFVHAAHDLEIPVVAPLALREGEGLQQSLGQAGGYYFAVFPKFRGSERAEHAPDDLRWLGRTLARLHNLGATRSTEHRLALNPQTYGHDLTPTIQAQTAIPEPLREPIELMLQQCLSSCELFFAAGYETMPIHGDCHHGNVLWNHDGPHLVDFDDMLVAPPVQDVWMLFHGSAEEMRAQREQFFSGYEIFREFPQQSLRLAEPLRTLRIIRHAAWIGERYAEEAFQRAFPYYAQARYWEEFAQTLREQYAALQELQWQ